MTQPDHKVPPPAAVAGIAATVSGLMARSVVLLAGALLLPAWDGRFCGVAEASTTAGATASRPRSLQVQRGSVEREMLWMQEGGPIEFVRYSGAMILDHRVGLIPPARFRQVQREIDRGGAIDDVFRLSTVLQPSARYGTFARLGAPALATPDGLVVPGSWPADHAAPGDLLFGIVQTLLTCPDRFLFLGENAGPAFLERLPTDRSGGKWIPDQDRWRPVLTYLRSRPR